MSGFSQPPKKNHCFERSVRIMDTSALSGTKPGQARPLVSFIITYYNLPVDMIRECIDSILSIDLEADEREIILVDDGSEVSPLNELTEYRDQLVYLRQSNKGPGGARNSGIDICHGEYIQFVDGDDMLIKANYDHCIHLLREQEADVVLFKHTTEENDVDSPYLFDGPMSGADYINNHNLRGAVWGYVFRKKLLHDLRFSTHLLHEEDEEFTPKLILRAENLYATDSCAYFYRVRPGSITQRGGNEWTAKKLNDAEYVLLQLDHLAGTLHGEQGKALQRRVAQLTMNYIYNVIVLTRSEQMLDERLGHLAQRGLFPLPNRNYTTKYKLFRRLVNTKAGRKVLLRTLPLLPKEK